MLLRAKLWPGSLPNCDSELGGPSSGLGTSQTVSQNGYKLVILSYSFSFFGKDRKPANTSACAPLESSERIPLGAGDASQWVEHLEGRHKDKSGIPSAHIDATQVWGLTCNSSTQKAETGLPRLSWLADYLCGQALSSVGRPCLRGYGKQLKKTLDISLGSPHMHIRVHAPMHICMRMRAIHTGICNRS